jgi:hypothetical protein
VAEHREEPARHEEGVDAHFGLLDDVGLGLLWLAARVGLDDRAGASRQRAESESGKGGVSGWTISNIDEVFMIR